MSQWIQEGQLSETSEPVNVATVFRQRNDREMLEFFEYKSDDADQNNGDDRLGGDSDRDGESS